MHFFLTHSTDLFFVSWQTQFKNVELTVLVNKVKIFHFWKHCLYIKLVD